MFGHIFHKESPTKKEKDPKQAHEDKPTGPESAPIMVPFLSWRTVLTVIIGAIIGIGIGLLYFIINPSFGSSGGTSGDTGEGGGFLQSLVPQPTTNVPWSTKVNIQLANYGSSYISLSELQARASYYAAKANSYSFFEFLSQELNKQTPEYFHKPNVLDSMIRITYVNTLAITGATSSRTSTTKTDIELPYIEVKATSNSTEETMFLAQFVPETFKSYLTLEENNRRAQEYQLTLEEIDNVKAALYKNKQELNNLSTNNSISKNPEYISLKAAVDALQQELNTQASQLSLQPAGKQDIQNAYDKTVEQINLIDTKLETAQRELQNLREQENVGGDINSTPRIVLDAKIRALQAELDRMMTGYTQLSGGIQTYIPGLAEMIANGDTTSTEYTNTLKKVTTTSQALADARKELADMDSQLAVSQTTSPEYRIAQIKVDTLNAQLTTLIENLTQLYQQLLSFEAGESQPDPQALFNSTSVALAKAKVELSTLESQLGYDPVSANLDVLAAQTKIDNLNQQLTTLSIKLSSLVAESTDSAQLTDSFLIGNPSLPMPELPPRVSGKNALILGIIVGIIGAWVVMNFRWIIKGMPSPKGSKQDKDGAQ